MIALLVILAVIQLTFEAENPNLFIRPIMYGTVLVLVFIGFFIIYWMYGLTYEKDPMIYSKFLSVKKNK